VILQDRELHSLHQLKQHEEGCDQNDLSACFQRQVAPVTLFEVDVRAIGFLLHEAVRSVTLEHKVGQRGETQVYLILQEVIWPHLPITVGFS